MINRGSDSRLFEEMIRELLRQGLGVRFQARGASMSPAIRDGEMVEVAPGVVSRLRRDDIVLAKSDDGFRLHRLVLADFRSDAFTTRGDCGRENDPVLRGDQIFGVARAKAVRVGSRIVWAEFRGAGAWALRCAARAQTVAQKILRISGIALSRPELSTSTRH